MAAGGDSSHGDVDLYAVLGLKKECTDAELRLAYRRLAMIWHPDRCSASGGSSTRVEEAKERFQKIQGAYSVLSDSNKRFLYDVGVYDSEDDDDDLSGMGDFLGEMVQMMSQATPTESFEELQQVFVDMFQADLDAGFCGGPTRGQRAQAQVQAHSPACTSRSPSWSSPPPCPHPPGRTNAQAPPSCNGANKRCSSATGSGKPPRPGRPGSCPGLGLSEFCFKGSDWRQREAPWTPDGSISSKRRSGRKQKLSTGHDVSSDDESSHPRQQRTL